MISDMLLHQSTRINVDQFLAKPTHALIIEGKKGSGKTALADYLSIKLLGIDPQKLNNYPYILKLQPTGQSLSIDEIRKAQAFLKLKTTGGASVRRILVVEQAELMTIEAQNAFLKILEEPPADTVIFVLTSQKIKLLPTIRSRTQSLAIKSLNRQEINQFFESKGHKPADINTAYYIGGSQIGLMSTLLDENNDDQTIKDFEKAKKVLGMSNYERLIYADEIIKQKQDIPSFIKALATICEAALKQTVDKRDLKHTKRWHHSLRLAVEAEKKLASNPNSKLLLTDLLINL